MLETIVMIDVKPGSMRHVENALLAREGLHELYSVAGSFDLVAILRTARNERLEELVREKSPLSTAASPRPPWWRFGARRGGMPTAPSPSA